MNSQAVCGVSLSADFLAVDFESVPSPGHLDDAAYGGWIFVGEIPRHQLRIPVKLPFPVKLYRSILVEIPGTQIKHTINDFRGSSIQYIWFAGNYCK